LAMQRDECLGWAIASFGGGRQLQMIARAMDAAREAEMPDATALAMRTAEHGIIIRAGSSDQPSHQTCLSHPGRRPSHLHQQGPPSSGWFRPRCVCQPQLAWRPRISRTGNQQRSHRLGQRRCRIVKGNWRTRKTWQTLAA
jgi:hypothetical protein